MDEFSAYSAGHHPDGLFVFVGPGVQAGQWLEGAQITDLAPTLMHVLDVPVASWMDKTWVGVLLHRRRRATASNLCGLRCGRHARG